MNTEELEGRIIDYIDGRLSEKEESDLEKEMIENPEAVRLYRQLNEVIGVMNAMPELEPGQNLRKKFDASLIQEGKDFPRGQQVFFTPVFYRVAAAVLLLVSVIGIGLWINRTLEREAELHALRKELDATKQTMMSMLGNTGSASQRLMGATVAFNMKQTDDQIILALAKAMNEDTNSNVRLVALEALSKFNKEDQVRRILIQSLATQKDPIVQIALIRLMVEIKEKEAVKELQRMTDDVDLMKAVKDEAHVGLLRLS